jgi:ATP-binding cassette subfamily F protein 3
MLRFENATVAVGGVDLLEGVDWHVPPGAKVGLVGRNGTGKTTLLRVAAGEHLLDSGKVERRANTRLGYLHQHSKVPPGRIVWEEVRSGMTALLTLEAELKRAEQAVERGEPGAVEKAERIAERFRLAGGYAMDERVGEVLAGLGFRKADWERPCETFSGGWQVRIALAKLLLAEPELLLLDEPTNHLDILARTWLAGFLGRSDQAVVVVSHDRHLLDRVTDRIVEVRNQRLHHFTGNFSSWMKQRTLRIEQEQAAYESQQEEIERLERFVDRFRAKATKAAQAQSRQKVLDKMDRLDAPEGEKDPRLNLPDAPPCSEEVVVIEEAALGWPGGPAVLQVDELVLSRGMRVALLGPNGAGKSTLLHSLAGGLPLQSGRRRVGRGVRVGFFTQDLARDLPADEPAVKVVALQAPMAPESKVRAALGALGLTGEMALRLVGSLSGGEKARVALAGFCVRPANLLLLDEPTNHLDVVTVEVLIGALQEFTGALVVSTHDRHLVEAIATHVAVIREGRLEIREGVRPEDFELSPLRADEASKNEVAAQSHAARKQEKRETDKMKKRLVEVQRLIEAEDEALARLDASLGEETVGARIVALAKERAQRAERQEALYAEWAELEERLA